MGHAAESRATEGRSNTISLKFAKLILHCYAANVPVIKIYFPWHRGRLIYNSPLNAANVPGIKIYYFSIF